MLDLLLGLQRADLTFRDHSASVDSKPGVRTRLGFAMCVGPCLGTGERIHNAVCPKMHDMSDTLVAPTVPDALGLLR